MSLRVVNLADTPAEMLIDRKQSSSSPSRRRHPHRRMSVQEDGFVDPITADDKDSHHGEDDDEEDEALPYQRLRGKTLGLFGPDNWFRILCAKVLRWRITEPLILVGILASVVLLMIQSWPNVYEHPRATSGYFHTWIDYALFALFCAFTLEIGGKIVVTGLMVNPPLPYGSPRMTKAGVQGSPLADHPAVRGSNLPAVGALQNLGSSVLSHLGPRSSSYPPREREGAGYLSASRYAAVDSSQTNITTADITSAKLETVTSHLDDPDSTLARLKTGKMRVPTAVPFVQSVRKQRSTYQDAFLRHSWNRIDALAIVSFWICFALAITGQESNHNVYIFRALSVLRATRLLAITEGTTIILSSLKRASPQLVELGFFVMFAMVLFSIIGVQSFRGSYQRSCFWVDPAGQLENVSLSQLCGGFVNSTGGKQGYYDVNGHIASNDAKGYVCQYPTVCMNDQNPDNGVISFDNILAALYNIVIVASANTWTGNMYDMMAAEDFYACLYFIVGVIVLNFWLINMFVAVITTSFGDMREETKHSAFASNKVTSGAGMDHLVPAEPVTHSSRFGRGTYWVRKVYGWSDRLWVSLILVDIVFQAMTTADAPESRTRMLSRLELGFTIALDLEMIIRAVACLPEWRSMFTKPRNQTDLILAVVTTIIQIPVIKNSAAYKWLQIFQIARFYRFVLSWPRLQRLLVKLTGTISGLINMIVFLLLMNLIVAIVSLQLFRGVPDADTDETPEMTYATTYNAFLATYQILSSENWTDVANNVLTNEKGQMQIVIAALLLSGWVLFGYFVLIQLFIAVINENFAIAEEEKRKQQLQQFVDRDQPKDSHISWIVRWNPYNRFRARPKAVAVDAIPSSLVLPMKKAVVRDYMTDYQSSAQEEKEPSSPTKISKLYAQAKRVLRLESEIEAVPMDELTSPTKDRASRAQDLFAPADRGVQYQYEEQVQGTNSERRARQADFITAHPSYDRSLWIFSQRNLLRRACQRLVDPAYGEVRIKGRPSVKRERRLFEFLIFFSIAGSVIVAAIATPVYRHNTLGESGSHRWTWYNLSEVGFSALFFVEFLVKVIADGFIFSPNAYLLSIWNQIDFVVLLTINVNIITTLTDQGNGFTRALKAFRALRLINLSSTMRTTFYNVLIVGATNIWDATFLAVLYVIPYAIWAQKVFSGLLFSCNDTSVTTKAECAGEFASAVIDDWEIMLPRVWQNPQVWSFDNFWKSLLIMCEIISLEGWIDVMESVMPLRGRNLQPFQDASQWNALFFVLYNLVGAVFILTLFVSIIIENFTHRSGMSLLTTEQRQWIDLRRLIMRQQPAKRPKQRPASRWRSWCFDRAVDKHGWWSRIMTFLYLAHVVILMTESTRDATWADKARNGVFLGLTIIYGLDIATKMVGLGLRSWWANGWNRYDFFIVAGTFANTLDVLFGSPNGVSIQLQKLFLVTIAFKLVQKNNSLNQLFKTARASVPSILSIFALWIIMFLVFAIFMTEVFGLTRWGSNETYASNYSTFPKAMVMLALASTGEGWNAFMHDYTVDFPNCTRSSNYLFNDCGTPAGAYALFFIWNVLSMYLMGNLILGAVVENFSGVFQKYGKVTSIDREQMRAYKRVWEDSDGGRKGFLRRGEIVPFFGRLTGVFEVKVWPTRFSIKNLQAGATPSDQPGALPDRARLARELSAIDVVEVRRRKERYNKLFHEAMIESENERGGISFKNMLLMLSHYCLIDDDKALRFEDLIDRRERVEKVMDRVYADRVTTLLQTVGEWWTAKLGLDLERPLLTIFSGFPVAPSSPTPVPRPARGRGAGLARGARDPRRRRRGQPGRAGEPSIYPPPRPRQRAHPRHLIRHVLLGRDRLVRPAL